MINTGKISEHEKVINSRNIKIVSFDNTKEDDLKIQEKEHPYILMLCTLIQFKKYGYSFTSRTVLSEKEQERFFECAIEYNEYYDGILMKYIEPSDKNDTMVNVIYKIPRNFIAISGIYPQKRNYDYVLNINLNNYFIKAGSEPEIRFDHHITLLTKYDTEVKISIPKEKIKDWINPAFKFKSLYYDTNTIKNMLDMNTRTNIS